MHSEPNKPELIGDKKIEKSFQLFYRSTAIAILFFSFLFISFSVFAFKKQNNLYSWKKGFPIIKFPLLRSNTFPASGFVPHLLKDQIPKEEFNLKKSIRTNNVVWTTPSKDSYESMPLSGTRGAGANIWVENGSIWLYLAHNAAYDENGRLLKLGCVQLTPVGFPLASAKSFTQEQDLFTGSITIDAKLKDGRAIKIRLQFAGQTLIIQTNAGNKLYWKVAYGTWRDQPKMVQMDVFGGKEQIKADTVFTKSNAILFMHKNGVSRYEDSLAKGQTVDRSVLLNILSNRNFGGAVSAKGGLQVLESKPVQWQTWQGKAIVARTNFSTNHLISIAIDAGIGANPLTWLHESQKYFSNKILTQSLEKENKRWEKTWGNSFVLMSNKKTDEEFQVGRNYQLFRQMLACNEGGEFPLKFNGGIFTTDPHFDRIFKRLNNPALELKNYEAASPDFRRWGQMFMAQNQRWIGWPTIANGDSDLLKPSIAFYRQRLPIAKQRAKNLNAVGACYIEPIEIAGMCCVTPDKNGLCQADHLIYHFSMATEFAWMALQAHSTSNFDIKNDVEWMVEILRFYDSFYRGQHKRISGKELNKEGELVIFPSNSLELLGEATNPIEVVAGLKRVTEGLLDLNFISKKDKEFLIDFHRTIPDFATKEINKEKTLMPALDWKKEYNPWEMPEMYAAWPYRFVGVTQPATLSLIQNTWSNISRAGENKTELKSKMDLSWQATVANVAAMGYADEAKQRVISKLSDKASSCRYPAFFGPGHDWMPDHNWGGSGMVGLQEMLLVSQPGSNGKIYLLPAWPKDWDVHFKLHTNGNTTVECEYKNGEIITLKVSPQARKKDLVIERGIHAKIDTL